MTDLIMGIAITYVIHLIVWKIVSRKLTLKGADTLVLSFYSTGILLGSGVISIAIANMTGLKLLGFLIIPLLYYGVKLVTPKVQRITSYDFKASNALFGKVIAITLGINVLLTFGLLFLLAALKTN